jgi:Zn-dependent protease with chaperone function
MFFIVILLIRMLKINNHRQRSHLYLSALLSSFSIMLYALFFFDIHKRGDSLIFLFPNQLRGLEFMLRESIESVGEGFGFLDLRLVLLILFMISLGVFFCLLFISRFYILRKYNLIPCHDERVLRLLGNICHETGARVPETMMFRGDINAFVFGFPPVLAIGEELLGNVGERELRLILKHEMNHIQNHDHVLKPFLFSLRILFFYNPCVHALAQLITKEREYLADKVSDMKKEKAFFLYTLVKLNERRGRERSILPSFISSPLVRSNLKMRTETLLEKESKCRSNPHFIFFWLFSILIFSSTYALGNLPPLRKEGFMEKNDMFHRQPPGGIFTEENFSMKKLPPSIADGFPFPSRSHNIGLSFFPAHRDNDGFQNSPFMPKKIRIIEPPLSYTINIRTMLMAFLLTPLLFIFSPLLSYSILTKKHLQ